MAAAFPLTWPPHIPRWNGARQAGQFKTQLSGALKNVTTSLQAFGRDSGKPVTDIILSSNITLGVTKPADPGVAVWFTWHEISICIPVDRYATVEANLQAIYHVLEARRVELRHGTLALVRATFQGFKALPAPDRPTWTWRDVLNIRHGTAPTEDEIGLAYRRAAKAADGEAALKEINIARDEAKQELGY
jgi:hypothetical protein